MVINWLKSAPKVQKEASPKEVDSLQHKGHKSSGLLDLAHEAIVKKSSMDDQRTLDDFIKMGWPYVEREKFKQKVRKKVWQIVSEESEFSDPEIIEEVTEKIVDAAENDPFYKKMFGLTEENK